MRAGLGFGLVLELGTGVWQADLLSVAPSGSFVSM